MAAPRRGARGVQTQKGRLTGVDGHPAELIGNRRVSERERDRDRVQRRTDRQTDRQSAARSDGVVR